MCCNLYLSHVIRSLKMILRTMPWCPMLILLVGNDAVSSQLSHHALLSPLWVIHINISLNTHTRSSTVHFQPRKNGTLPSGLQCACACAVSQSQVENASDLDIINTSDLFTTLHWVVPWLMSQGSEGDCVFFSRLRGIWPFSVASLNPGKQGRVPLCSLKMGTYWQRGVNCDARRVLWVVSELTVMS